MRDRANWIKAGIAIVAVLLILVPLAAGHRHPGKGMLAGTHCQGCLSAVMAVSVMTTVPALAAPAESPFRLLPVEEAVSNSAGVASRGRAPPLACL